MHIFVDASCTDDTGPSRPQSSARLDEFTFEDKDKLWKLVGVDPKPSSGSAAHDLHFPAICRGDVLHEHTRGERRRSPWEAVGVHTPQGTTFKPTHGLLLAAQRGRSAAPPAGPPRLHRLVRGNPEDRKCRGELLELRKRCIFV